MSLSLLGDSRCRQSLALLFRVSLRVWLIVVWSPQYGCTGDYPRNPDAPNHWSRLIRLQASGESVPRVGGWDLKILED